MAAADLPAVLAVQAQCYRPDLIEAREALESRLAMDPQLCWVATRKNPADDGQPSVAAYLLTHRWNRETLPALGAVLEPPCCDAKSAVPPSLTWYVHDMAVSPMAQGHGLAGRLYDAACRAARQAGLRCSRLVAVQAAARWWRRMGYAPVALPAQDLARLAPVLAHYGEGALMMERRLDAATTGPAGLR